MARHLLTERNQTSEESPRNVEPLMDKHML